LEEAEQGDSISECGKVEWVQRQLLESKFGKRWTRPQAEIPPNSIPLLLKVQEARKTFDEALR
jgi:hypothetical protein